MPPVLSTIFETHQLQCFFFLPAFFRACLFFALCIFQEVLLDLTARTLTLQRFATSSVILALFVNTFFLSLFICTALAIHFVTFSTIFLSWLVMWCPLPFLAFFGILFSNFLTLANQIDLLKLQLHDEIYRLRFYSNSLIHILSLSNWHNNVASLQKNRGDKSHHVIVALMKHWHRVFFCFSSRPSHGCDTA